jgi:SAM-dependent methyltransferase
MLFSASMGAYADQDWHSYFDQIIPHVRTGATVLDVGSGRGGLAAWLQTHFKCSVLCVDYSDVALQICGSKGLPTLKVDVNTEFDTIPGRYDVVLFASSLESILDPVSMLNAARLKVAPGGCLLIWMPNSSSLRARLLLLRGKAIKQVGHSVEARKLGIWGYDDIHFFTKDSLAQALEAAGFSRLVWHNEIIRPDWRRWNGLFRYSLKLLARALIQSGDDALFSPYLCVVARVDSEKPGE